MNLSIKLLNESSWADFEALAQAHNGVWGGCWCTWFHPRDKANRGSAELTKAYKKKLALEGALALIDEAGGGTVESYPQDTQNQKISSSFLYNGTRSIFEECGFEYIGPKGKNHTIMRKIVAR